MNTLIIILPLITIAVIATLGKFLEDCRKIILAPKSSGKRFVSIVGLYECLNVHLSLTLGLLGLIIALAANQNCLLFMIVLIFAGVTSKGVFSDHKPERLHYKDSDALFGLIIPNACACAAVVLTLGVLFCQPSKDQQNNNTANSQPAINATNKSQ